MTSIEILIKEISEILGSLKTEPMQDLLLVDAINKAKEMHKKEMQTACHKMQIISKIDFDGNVYFMFSPKDYYKQTFEDANR